MIKNLLKSFRKKKQMLPEEEKNQQENAQEQTAEAAVAPEQKEQVQEEDELSKAKKEIEELKDKYLRLYSEFDNFRRRTSKEKIDLIKSANEDVLTSLISVIDDFERAQKSMEASTDVTALKEGVGLIYSKLYRTLESKGLKPMESAVGKEFNSELQEAVTQAPAPSEELKGKVIDEIEKGYYLQDKVIRFAKVIIGA
jgi:molecular chaperone GrpE